MSENTHDIRTKVGEREHLVLTAVSQSNGQDIAEIVRNLIVKFADQEVIRASKVTAILRGSEGSRGSAGE